MIKVVHDNMYTSFHSKFQHCLSQKKASGVFLQIWVCVWLMVCYDTIMYVVTVEYKMSRSHGFPDSANQKGAPFCDAYVKLIIFLHINAWTSRQIFRIKYSSVLTLSYDLQLTISFRSSHSRTSSFTLLPFPLSQKLSQCPPCSSKPTRDWCNGNI